MQLDSEHVLFWMDAIRNSADKERTLETFWKGQLHSKEWLIKELRKHIKKVITVDIHGGWNGLLASLLFQSNIVCSHIRSVDIDPTCEETARTMNKIEEMSGRFKAITGNMCNIRSDADVIINTSCEHLTQDEYDLWLSGHPQNSLIVIQSNNFPIPEHVRIVESIDEFVEQSNLEVLYKGEMPLHLFSRYMIIGRKRV